MEKNINIDNINIYENSENEALKKPSKKRRRLLGRPDGRRIRSLPPISRVSPYIMKTRVGATSYISDSVEIGNMEKYIRQKRAEACLISALCMFLSPLMSGRYHSTTG